MKAEMPYLKKALLFLALGVLFSGCSNTNPESPLSLVDASGRHPAGWIDAHMAYAKPDGSLCMDCHGEDLSGGVSGVSCSTGSYGGQSCHANGPAFHPFDWVNKAATGNTWHANAYQGGLQIGGMDCEDCHTPPALDVGKCVVCHFTLGGSRSPGGWTHGSAGHEAYAGSPEETVCVTCHEVNNRYGHEPFCHNCHQIHPEPDWAQRALHGVAAKQAPGSMTGFVTCASCHADDFTGGTAGVSCLTAAGCHQAGAPHPYASRWRSESTPTHTSTSRTNAPACGLCHLNRRTPPAYQPLPPGANPGCTNNTLCHGNAD